MAMVTERPQEHFRVPPDLVTRRLEAFELRIAHLERSFLEQKQYVEAQYSELANRWMELNARETRVRAEERALSAQSAQQSAASSGCVSPIASPQTGQQQQQQEIPPLLPPIYGGAVTPGGSYGTYTPQDIIRLNVGGQQECAVRRQTLCLVEGSMLADQFSGRWDEMSARDEKGRALVDFPPELFMPLVNWLRLKSIEDPSHPIPTPTIPQEHARGFKQMCEYYGIANSLWPADWQSLHKTIVQDGQRVQAVEFGNWSFEAWAISNLQEGCFSVTADANAFLESDAFRFGLCKRGFDISERLKAVHHVHNCDWDFDDFVSPSHTGRDGDIPFVADRLVQVIIRIRHGQLVITLKADQDFFELSPMTLPISACPKSWRIFVALSHPSLHVKREDW